MILNMALFSGMLLLPIYVQNIRGITPMDAGLLLMPGALLMAFMSPLTGKLFDRYGGRVLAVIGLAIMAVTTYFLSRLELDTTYAHLMIIYAVRSCRYLDGHDAGFNQWIKSITTTFVSTWYGYE